MIRRHIIEVSPVGADGVATATATLSLGRASKLLAVSIDYQNQPATADVEVRADSSTGEIAYEKANSATDVSNLKVRDLATDKDGADIAGAPAEFTSSGGWFCKVAQGDAGATKKVVFSLTLER